MIIKGVIFDLDGTLGNTFPVIFPSYRYALAKFTNQTYSDKDIMAFFGPSEDGVLQRLIPTQWEEALKAYEYMYKQLTPTHTQKFDGIDDVLSMLKNHGVKLAVVTGKGISTAHISLKELGIAHYFDEVEGGSPKGVIKPACMRKIIAKWGLIPSDVAYVGDVPSDMQDAREVGVFALAAAWNEHVEIEKLKNEKPDAIFLNVESFYQWLKQHINGKNL